MFTLSAERCNQTHRSKTQRGERVGAEIETPVRSGGLYPWQPRCYWRRFWQSPSSGIALAQTPPGNELTLVNADRDFVERKKGGEFVARPVFDRRIEVLHYAVRDADTGDWISAVYRVSGGEKERSDGWEYSWEYPALDEQPDLDRDRAYLLVMLAQSEDNHRGDFYAVVPIHEPGRIWDKILSALNPAVGEGLRRLGDRGSPRDPLRRG